LYPYFTRQKSITRFRTEEIDNYIEWRRKNNRYGEDMSLVTIKSEMNAISQIFKFALRRKYLGPAQMPEFNPPKLSKTTKQRRPHFELHEYRKLMRFLIHWGKQSVVHQEVRYLAHLLAHSGLRIGEARKLKWRQFVSGNQAFRINDVMGKTGPRDGPVICDLSLGQKMKRWRELTECPGDNDLVFPSNKRTHERCWVEIMEETGLRSNDNDEARTWYSLRHTYATYRLIYGRTDVYNLARNMGTSVKMIEDYYGHTQTDHFVEDLVRRRSRRNGI